MVDLEVLQKQNKNTKNDRRSGSSDRFFVWNRSLPIQNPVCKREQMVSRYDWNFIKIEKSRRVEQKQGFGQNFCDCLLLCLYYMINSYIAFLPISLLHIVNSHYRKKGNFEMKKNIEKKLKWDQYIHNVKKTGDACLWIDE